MKRLPLFLFLALCGLSLSLGFGWWQVYQTKKQIEVQLKQNQDLMYRNAALQAEIQDLKSSQDAVQERARLQLGMIKRNEVFVQVMDQPSVVQPGSQAAPLTPNTPDGAKDAKPINPSATNPAAPPTLPTVAGTNENKKPQ